MMAYYAQNQILREHTRARAGDLNNEFLAITAGFGKIPDEELLKTGAFTWGVEVAASAANAYVLKTLSPTAGVAAGALLRFRVRHTNSAAAATLAVDNAAAAALKRHDGSALSVAMLQAGAIVECGYDGTQWRLLAGGAQATLHFSEVLPQTAMDASPLALSGTAYAQLKAAMADEKYLQYRADFLDASEDTKLSAFFAQGQKVAVSLGGGKMALDTSGATAGTVEVSDGVAPAAGDHVTIYGQERVFPRCFVSLPQDRYRFVLNTQIEAITLPEIFDAPAGVVYAAADLPAGLTFNIAGRTITGTPTEIGVHAVVYTAVAGGETVSIGFDVEVSSSVLAVSEQEDLELVQGIYYAEIALNAPLSGQAPFSYRIDAQDLPPGLAFNGVTGIFTGAPSTAGTYRNLQVVVSDSLGQEVTLTFNIVVAHTLSLTLRPETAYTIIPGVQANIQLPAASGGGGAYVYALTGLPAGLSFDTAQRIISGLTTAGSGSHRVQYSVTDGLGSVVSANVSLDILQRGKRITAAAATQEITSTILSAGVSFAVNAQHLRWPTFSGNHYLLIAQPVDVEDIHSVTFGIGNSISAFTKLDETVTYDGVDYNIWLTSDIQGDVISGDAFDVE